MFPSLSNLICVLKLNQKPRIAHITEMHQLAHPGRQNYIPNNLAQVRQNPTLLDFFQCMFPACARSFPTKTDRGVHMRRMHSDWTDNLYRSETVKVRWRKKEVSLLARCEAELSMEGMRFINQELLGYLLGRTLEANKDVRKHAIQCSTQNWHGNPTV